MFIYHRSELKGILNIRMLKKSFKAMPIFHHLIIVRNKKFLIKIEFYSLWILLLLWLVPSVWLLISLLRKDRPWLLLFSIFLSLKMPVYQPKVEDDFVNKESINWKGVHKDARRQLNWLDNTTVWNQRSYFIQRCVVKQFSLP